MNATSDSSKQCSDVSEAFRVVHLVISILLTVTGLMGNTLVISVIAATTRLHTVMSAFVVNLAIADLISCLTTLTISCAVVTKSYEWPFDYLTCSFMAAFHILTRVTANFSLTLLAIDRCLAIWIPLRYSSIMTQKVAISAITIVWLLGILIACLPIITGQGFHFNNCSILCTPRWRKSKATAAVILILGFCIPLILTVISYSSIGYVAVKQAKRGTLVCDENNCHFVPNRKKELKVLKTPLCVTGVAIVCWTPYLAIGLWSLGRPRTINFYIDVGVETLSQFTIAINPILYVTLFQPCRAAIRRYKKRLSECVQRHREEENKQTSTQKGTTPVQSIMLQELSKGTDIEMDNTNQVHTPDLGSQLSGGTNSDVRDDAETMTIVN